MAQESGGPAVQRAGTLLSPPRAEEFLRGRTVLIVEDEGITVMQLERIVREAGMRLVGAARSAAEGVEIALRERPEVILMDVNMAGDYNGIEAVRRIMSVYRACILMLTAYADHDDAAATAGACGYVVKPLDRATLVFQIAEALKRFVAEQARP